MLYDDIATGTVQHNSEIIIIAIYTYPVFLLGFSFSYTLLYKTTANKCKVAIWIGIATAVVLI